MKEIFDEILKNRTARVAAKENSFRFQLAELIISTCEEKGFDPKVIMDEIGLSATQMRRLLHREVGGNLQLKSIVKILDFLDLDLTFEVSKAERR